MLIEPFLIYCHHRAFDAIKAFIFFPPIYRILFQKRKILCEARSALVLLKAANICIHRIHTETKGDNEVKSNFKVPVKKSIGSIV